MNDERRTPQWLFDKLNSIYHFTLDAAASAENHKCDSYYTIETDGLAHQWYPHVVFVNPPYSRGQLIKWVEKARQEYYEHSTTVVMILPGDTSTKWFPWDANKLIFLHKRVAFDGIKAGAKFPTCIAIWERDPLMELGKVVPLTI